MAPVAAHLTDRVLPWLPVRQWVLSVPMRTLAFLTDPPVVRSILVHLNLPDRPPPVALAHGPPQGDFLLDQSGPEFEFAQSAPYPID